jgi:hypothetical protein
MTDTDGSSDSDDEDSCASACEDESVTQNNDDKADSSLPHLQILHDSVLKDIDSDRLGKSYGLRVTKRKTPTAKECVQDRNIGAAPDAILIHVGVNDLKNQTPETVGKELCKRIYALLKQQADTKIIISKLTPTTDDQLYAKGEVLNALLFAELFATERVSFISHHQLQRQGNKGHLKDGLHPSLKGSGIMAGNIGRHVHGLLWEKPKQRRRRSSPRQAAGGQKTDRNTGHVDETTQDHRHRGNRPLAAGRGQYDTQYRGDRPDWQYRTSPHDGRHRDRQYAGQHHAGSYSDENIRYWQNRRDQTSRRRTFRDQRHNQQHEHGYRHDYCDINTDAARYLGYKGKHNYRRPHRADYRDIQQNTWRDGLRY